MNKEEILKEAFEKMESLGMSPFSTLEKILMSKGYTIAENHFQKLQQENERLKEENEDLKRKLSRYDIHFLRRR